LPAKKLFNKVDRGAAGCSILNSVLRVRREIIFLLALEGGGGGGGQRGRGGCGDFFEGGRCAFHRALFL